MHKLLIFFTGASIALAGCQKPDTSEPNPSESTQSDSIPKAKPVKEHFYDFKDGLDYGYSAAISGNQAQAGQVINQVIMVKYAGTRNGKHQIHITEGKMMTAVECSDPCEVVKIMSFINADYLRDNITVQRYRFNPESVMGMALTDAFNGRLHKYGGQRGDKTYQIWVDEKLGYKEYLVPSPSDKAIK